MHDVIVFDDADNEMGRFAVTNSQSDDLVAQLPEGWYIKRVANV
jgi:hypothetical protein